MKTTKNLLFVVVLAFLFVLGISSFGAITVFAADPNMVKPGEFVIEPPTLINLGFEWYVEGDDNHDASVEVWYRKKGDSIWKEALPLFRLQHEIMGGSFVNPNMFAGSIFDLEPDTEYECKFIMSDPDGVRGKAHEIVTVRTRAEPQPFQDGRILHVYPSGYAGIKEQPAYTGLNAAYRISEPGDTILVHPGLYKTTYSYIATYILTRKGTPEKPIVIKNAPEAGDVIFDGDGCPVLFNVMGAHYNYFEGITIRNTDLGILAGLSQVTGCDGLTVKKCRFENVGISIFSQYVGSKNFYVADNVMLGRQDPTRLVGWITTIIDKLAGEPPPYEYAVRWQDYPGYPAQKGVSSMAIQINGSGHVVCHNYIAHFFDGIFTSYSDPEEASKQVSNDFYNNFIFNINDNALQIDDAGHNYRVFRNLLLNGAHIPMCWTITWGGPVYAIRNITYHFPSRGSIKLYDHSGNLVALHNTITTEVSTGDVVVAPNGVLPQRASSNTQFLNNLILGENALGMGGYKPFFRGVYYVATSTNYSSSDYNGFRLNEEAAAGAQFVWNSPAFDLLSEYDDMLVERSFGTLAELCQVTGQECHGRIVDYDIFQNVQKTDLSDPTTLYYADDLDFRLKPGAAAIDAGCILPNINDNFTGNAPDLGALEFGQPVPIYGPRP
jgi:hypothetical protein